MLKTLRRWRTWVFNAAALLLVVLPEIVQALAGFNWVAVVPPEYMPAVTILILVVNVLMRPRPAALPDEARSRRRK